RQNPTPQPPHLRGEGEPEGETPSSATGALPPPSSRSGGGPGGGGFASADVLPALGGLAALLEDDDLFSLHLSQFLAEHQVPCAVPLYDEQGRYLFALPDKVGVLARALLQAVSRGRDNELYVLLADLLELDASLAPLLQAVRVALGRH